MKIDDMNFGIDFCCYEMYEHMFAFGISIDWAYCPYCGKTFEFQSENANEMC